MQSYHLRLCVSRDPGNQVPVTRPDDYDAWQPYLRRRYPDGCAVGGNPIPNRKANWWQNLPRAAWDWADGSWERRSQIVARFEGFARSLLYYLHHDPAVPEAVRASARQWALAADEFTDNRHLPTELYVREARRLVGRCVLTEHDCVPAPGRSRPPACADSIAFTEWFMDSHEVSEEAIDGCREGKIILTHKSRPGMVPYRCLLPREVDNLLVPVCLSATHVAWGQVRLEPTWMHVGESAGFAAAEAKARGVAVADIDVGALQSRLLAAAVPIAYFNQLDRRPDTTAFERWQRAACAGDALGYDQPTDQPHAAVHQ